MKSIFAVIIAIFIFVGGWLGRKIFEKFLDKKFGKQADEFANIVVDKLLEPAFNAMKEYLSKNTPDEVKTKAQNGDPEAQFNLGSMFYFARGVRQDYSEAVKWFRKAAEQGLANAQGALKALGETW